MGSTAQRLASYKNRCGGCVFFKNAYKYGVETKAGWCTEGFSSSKHRASDKACLRYKEKEGTV